MVKFGSQRVAGTVGGAGAASEWECAGASAVVSIGHVGYAGPTNDDGIEIIKSFEGYSPTVYFDPVGIPTIGYGSTWDLAGDRVTMDHPPIDERVADALLQREVRHAEQAVRRLISHLLTSNEFSALVSFTYNLGAGNLQRSTLRMKLNRGDVFGAANELPKWRRAGGRVLRGLVRRRAVERALFLRA